MPKTSLSEVCPIEAADCIAADFASAFQDKSISQFGRIIELVDQELKENHRGVHDKVISDARYADNIDSARTMIADWAKGLKVGDKVDFYEALYGEWYPISVRGINRDRDEIDLHFLGWGKLHDKTVALSDMRVLPMGAITKYRTKKPERAQAPGHAAQATPEYGAPLNSATGALLTETAAGAVTDANVAVKADPDSAVATAATATAEPVAVSSRGRRVRAVNYAVASSYSGVPTVPSVTSDAAPSQGEGKGKGSGADKGGKSLSEADGKPQQERDVNDWVCGLCGALEAEDGSDLVLCEGPCKRSFHFGCLPLEERPVSKLAVVSSAVADSDCEEEVTADGCSPRFNSAMGQQEQQGSQLVKGEGGDGEVGRTEEAPWLCRDCRTGRHRCFICGKRGRDFKRVVKCNHSTCGRFYHRDCLENIPDDPNDFLATTVRDMYYDTVAKTFIKELPKNYKPQSASVKSEHCPSSASALAHAQAQASTLSLKTDDTERDDSGAGKHSAAPMEAPASHNDPEQPQQTSPAASTTASADVQVSATESGDVGGDVGAGSGSGRRRSSRVDYKSMHSPKMPKPEKPPARPKRQLSLEAGSRSRGKGAAKRRRGAAAGLESSDEDSESDIDGRDRYIKSFQFRCPCHQCYNCYPLYNPTKKGASKKGGGGGGGVESGLQRCLLCPRAFHTQCILPGSRSNSLCLLCPRHGGVPLPSQDAASADATAAAGRANAGGLRRVLGGSLSGTSPGKKPRGRVAQELQAAQERHTQFWGQLSVPDLQPHARNPHDFGHFKLQVHLKDALRSAPPAFTVIQRNDYQALAGKAMPSTFKPEVRCECTELCGEGCLNRVLRIECCESSGANSSSSSGIGGDGGGRGRGGKKAEGDICNVGPHCTNRALQQRKYAETEVFHEAEMGWGLRAKTPILEGQLVIEYLGEVIDYAEVHRRMSDQRRLTPQDRDFYIMELDSGLYVDGKFRGNRSRFINHSCDPNCELQRWVVRGKMCIGIFAVKDIAAGQPLSYDYQFDTNEAETFRCYCGSANCRGTMAPKKRDRDLYADYYDENGVYVGKAGGADGRSIGRDERQRLISLGKLKEQSITSEGLVAGEWSRSYTGRALPGDSVNEVRGGPVRGSLTAGRAAGLLLVRNVIRGTAFISRAELLNRRIQRAQTRKGKAGPNSSSSSSLVSSNGVGGRGSGLGDGGRGSATAAAVAGKRSANSPMRTSKAPRTASAAAAPTKDALRSPVAATSPQQARPGGEASPVLTPHSAAFTRSRRPEAAAMNGTANGTANGAANGRVSEVAR